MRKFTGYVPAVLFTAFYILSHFTGSSRLSASTALILLIFFWAAAAFVHKGFYYGCISGMLPGIFMLYTGITHTSPNSTIHIMLGIIILLFYCILGVYLHKKRDNTPASENTEVIKTIIKLALTAAVIMIGAYFAIVLMMVLLSEGIHQILVFIGISVIPTLFLPLIWLKNRKKFLLIWLIPAGIYFISLCINYGIVKYDESITINTSPNIYVGDYMPFDEDSKIVKYDSKTLKLTDNLPKIDGAAALFPVYSSFVNAVYPETIRLHDGIFEYNNTPEGYRLLAEKETDIFIGVYPSEEQKTYAEKNNTVFEYTPIGAEAFVFFVHKDNPIDNLSSEQIRGIYSGEITNWRDVGGRNEEIAAFQRNEGSGSQSMLKRFMGDTPITEPPTELRNDLMSGIVEQVSNYKSKSNSIGFSFRYYVEGIIKNPDIKIISVDGIAPTAENIKLGKYPIITPILAVTYKEQANENVNLLLDWILSTEGQYIIEETGYVGIASE